jgi:AcrR family transcriptional regulator
MPRPNQTDEQRRKLLPIVCQVFSELGYRRTTTAELAERCGVRENILYRLWPDKKAMFLAAIDDIFQQRAEMWARLLSENPNPERVVASLVAYEAKHQGEFGFYRVVFTALAETDDADIRSALKDMYRRFQQLVKRHVEEGRVGEKRSFGLSVDAAAWALIGLATVSNIVRELELLSPRQREQMFAAVAKHLVEKGAK